MPKVKTGLAVKPIHDELRRVEDGVTGDLHPFDAVVLTPVQVLKWQKGSEDEAGGGEGPIAAGAVAAAGAGGLTGRDARRAGQALPFAVALAAALSVESPFVHIDTVGKEEEGEEEGERDGGGEEQPEEEEDGEEAGWKGGKRRQGDKRKRGRRRGDEGEEEEEEDAEEEEMEGEREEEEGGRGRRGAKAAPGRAAAAAAAAKEAAREAARRRRQHAAAMQAKFRDPHSDALSALAALVAYEASGESEAFAAQHFLHARNLREAADLHRQLLRALSLQQVGASQQQQQKQGRAAGGGDGSGSRVEGEGGELAADLAAAAARELSGSMLAAVTSAAAAAAAVGGKGAAAGGHLVPERVAKVLRRAMAAGWADQVARRARSAEYLRQLGESRWAVDLSGWRGWDRSGCGKKGSSWGAHVPGPAGSVQPFLTCPPYRMVQILHRGTSTYSSRRQVDTAPHKAAFRAQPRKARSTTTRPPQRSATASCPRIPPLFRHPPPPGGSTTPYATSPRACCPPWRTPWRLGQARAAGRHLSSSSSSTCSCTHAPRCTARLRSWLFIHSCCGPTSGRTWQASRQWR